MKICIVEDHIMFSEVLGLICSRDLGYAVVGVASRVEEAKSMVRQTMPDLVLLDLHLADGLAFEVIREVRDDRSVPKYIAISAYCSELIVHHCDELRVAGFLDKRSCSIGTLREAIGTVAEGGVFYSPTYLKIWLQLRTNPSAFSRVLSPWEQRILELIGCGDSDAEIAVKLGMADATAKGHRSAIMRKLGVSSSTKLMAKAQRIGFGRLAVQG